MERSNHTRPDQPFRRVLFVSYYSPPFGGPQGFRAAQFLRHLPDQGWVPRLLTAKASLYEGDPGPGDAASFTWARRGAIEAGGLPVGALVRRIKGERRAPDANTSAEAPRHSRMTRAAALLATPDRLATWIPFAVGRGLPAARSSDLIYAAGPPYTNHMVAIALAKLTGKPLVSMVDDPWGSMSHGVWYSETQRRLHARVESASLRSADRILVGTEGFASDLANRFPAETRGKLRLVLWGFDPVGDSHAPPPQAPPVRFVYAGSLRGPHYDPSALFAALRSLATEGDLASRMRLDFYGIADARYVDMAAGLEQVVRFHGFRPHQEVEAAICDAHATVLLIADTHPEFEWYTSAKVFTYAGARRPTLALVPPNGDASRLVRDRSLGVVAPPSDPDAIAAAIRRIVGEHESLRRAMGNVDDLTSAAVVAAASRAFDEAVAARG